MEISKKDWMLFRERIGVWQESYMERLAQEDIQILSSEKAGSQKFWELEKRLRADKKSPGVQLRLSKGNVPSDLAGLVSAGVISWEALDGFSEELKDCLLDGEQFKALATYKKS